MGIHDGVTFRNTNAARNNTTVSADINELRMKFCTPSLVEIQEICQYLKKKDDIPASVVKACMDAIIQHCDGLCESFVTMVHMVENEEYNSNLPLAPQKSEESEDEVSKETNDFAFGKKI